MAMLYRYAILSLLSVVVGLGVAVAWQRAHIASLTVQRDRLAARVETCDARVANILEARESNAIIDNIGDLSISPNPEWMQ
jgi:hypothetical protein